MKYFFTFIFAVVLAITACNSPVNSDSKTRETKTDSVPSKEVYACPMHPEISSDKPGTCSKCGMDLEKK